MQITKEEAWNLITSYEGLAMWLGVVKPSFELDPKHKYVTEDGTSGEIRVVKPFQQLRLTWQKKAWVKPSTVQIRILPAADGKTTLSFHQENLKGPLEREEMKAFWEEALEEISKKLQPN